VNVQLISAQTGNHLWAERFDNSITDLFDVQDEIVSRLANTLDAQLIAAEACRAERSLHPDAMDLYFQGIARMHKGLTNEHMAQALGFFERALALDPGNIEALVGVALIDLNRGANFSTGDGAARLAAAEATLIKVLSMDPHHAQAHMHMGYVQIFTNRANRGIAECEQALALDRNLPNAHALIGLAKYFLGRGEETEGHIHEALHLSPRDIFAFRWMMWVGLAKVQLNSDAEAVAWYRRGVDANRNFPLAHFHLAAALAQLGLLDEARAAAQAGLTFNPGFTVRRFRAAGFSDNPNFLAGRERMYEGLRMAGVPEG
jgi:tetratricopeptide (TPR) repeat protein